MNARLDKLSLSIPFDHVNAELNLDENPQLMFGVLSDIQYANVENRPAKNDKPERRYRDSLTLVANAIDAWKTYETSSGIEFKFLLQLGDLIDRKSRKINDSLPAVESVLTEMKKIDHQLLHVWGNHEMDNFKRSDLIHSDLFTAGLQRVQLNDVNANYYSYEINDKLLLICLDLYEFSLNGYEKSDSIYKQADLFVKDLKKKSSPLSRWPKLNGGITDTQLKWLDSQLDKCKAQQRKAIVCGHIPLISQVSTVTKLVWNAQEILELFNKHSSVVLVYLAGHFHYGGHFLDESNSIHHLTLPAVVEANSLADSMLTVEVYSQRLAINLGNKSLREK